MTNVMASLNMVKLLQTNSYAFLTHTQNNRPFIIKETTLDPVAHAFVMELPRKLEVYEIMTHRHKQVILNRYF